MKCFACKLDGHMKGSRACKKEKPKAPTKGKKGKEKGDEATTRQVEDIHRGIVQTVRRPTEWRR